MSIKIDRDRCVGCQRCTAVCPGSLIEMQAGKAVMKYPRNCWGCASCVKECPAEAIAFFLGADIGGSGSTMTVSESGDVLHWKIHCWDGTVKVIDVDRKNANQY